MIKVAEFYQEIRAGSSLPLIVGGSDGHKYVIKLRGSGEGILANVVEFLSLNLGRLAQIPVLEPVCLWVEADFAKKGFILEQLLVRNITLPASVKESIERKINAEQDAQRMEYVLAKGRQEAELKRVEAQGQADAQKIMSEGLSEKVLQYEMIKVQKELANSPNSKLIILGGGKSSPPVILDGK